MSSEILGVIAPHPPIMVEAVGGAEARATDASAASMHEAAEMLRAFDPDTVVLISPHAPALADAFVVETAPRSSGSLASFGAPQVDLTYSGDPEFARHILERLHAVGITGIDRADAASLRSGELDHGVLVPMSFLDPEGRWPLLVLSLSRLSYADHATLGHAVAAAAADLGRRIAFVASGDCSHHLTHDAPAGFDPRGRELDRQMVELIGNSDFASLSTLDPALVDGGGECGLRSFITLGAAAEPAHARVLSYEGPWGVGYLTAVVNEHLVTPDAGEKGGAAGSDESEIVRLARQAIEAHVRRGETLRPAPLSDPGLPPRAGTFVTLHRHDSLRGCIGTILATEPTLAAEVVSNAIQAAAQDPRFSPLGPEELHDLDVKVDVLHAPEPCELQDLDPRLYGVIVTSGRRRGLLLPDLDGVDTIEEQIAIASRKAGIALGEPVALQRFRVDRHA